MSGSSALILAATTGSSLRRFAVRLPEHPRPTSRRCWSRWPWPTPAANALEQWGRSAGRPGSANDPDGAGGLGWYRDGTRITGSAGNGSPTDLDAGSGNAAIPAQVPGGPDHPQQPGVPAALPIGGRTLAASSTSAERHHSWGYWGAQLQAMKPDIQRVLERRTDHLTTGATRLGPLFRDRASPCARLPIPSGIRGFCSTIRRRRPTRYRTLACKALASGAWIWRSAADLEFRDEVRDFLDAAPDGRTCARPAG